jgi:hypothetical protein
VGSTSVLPGGTVDVTVIHESRAVVAGVLIDSGGSGSIGVVDLAGTHLFEGTVTQATHAMPHVIVDGRVTFPFTWTAPAEPGVSRLDIYSVAANDNRDPHDDSANHNFVDIAHGCDGIMYFPDADGDGFGSEAGRELSCEPLIGLITVGGDCDDTEADVYLGAPELCNVRDDNCDGQIDEGLTGGLFYPDADGDGFGANGAQTVFGCDGVVGFAREQGDCDDANAAISPAVVEVANGIDDNCNREIDEPAPACADPSLPGCAAGPAPAGTCPGPGCPGATPETAGCRVSPGNSAGFGANLAAILTLGLGFWALRARRRRLSA